MKDIQQLIKKNSQQGRYEDIFPKTFIDAVEDRESGNNLNEILSGFNMYFLSYNGSRELTRLQVPLSLRKTGLWITYVLYDKTVITEWYAGEAIDDNSWRSSGNWRVGTNMLVGDISISSDGYWVVNGVITTTKAQGEQGLKGDKGDKGEQGIQGIQGPKGDTGLHGEQGITPMLRVGSNNHLQASYTNGSSWEDVSTNPIYTQFRVSNNKLQQSTDLGESWSNISEELAYQFRNSGNKLQVSKDLGVTWEDTSDYIAAWFKFTGTTGSSQADNVGKIQISRDNGVTWSDLSGEFTNSLYIKGYVATVGTLPSSAVQGDIYGVGPTYDPSDTEQTNPIYQLYVKDSTGWINNGKFTSISAGVVQELGDSETAVISQKTISDRIQRLENEVTAFFTGTVTVDFDNLSVSTTQGFLLAYSKVVSISAQSLNFDTINAQYLTWDVENNHFSLVDAGIPYEGTNPIIGRIDTIGHTVFMNCARINTLKYENIKGEGYYLTVDASKGIKLTIIQSDSVWEMTVDSGYVFSSQGNEPLITTAKTTIKFSDRSLVYLYAKTNGEILCYPYNSTDNYPDRNTWLFIGWIDPTSRKWKLNSNSVFLNDDKEEKFYATDIANIGRPTMEVVPTRGWLGSKVWNSELTSNNVYVDIRCVINSHHQFDNLKALASQAGNAFIVYINKATNAIIYKQPITLVEGENIIPNPGLSYENEMYVGVQGVDGLFRTVFPSDGNSYGFQLSGGNLIQNDYSFAYEINILNTSSIISSRVEKLESTIEVPEDADINQLLSNNDAVTLGPRDYIVTSPLILTSGKTLRGSFGKTRLLIQNGVECAIKATNATDISISDLEIVGNQVDYKYAMNGIVEDPSYNTVVTEDDAINFAYMGSENGIYLASCEKVILNNLKIRNVTGSAIRVNRVGRDYIWGLKSSNIFISNCYNGIYGENEHEYSEYTNFSITLCMIGIYFNSGNLIFSGGHTTRCRVGIMLLTGYNHAHGFISNVESKHNQVASLLVSEVDYGEYFNGLYIQYGNLIIRNSQALFFPSLYLSNGSLICTNDSSVNGRNLIGNLVSYGAISLDISSGNITIQNNNNLLTS